MATQIGVQDRVIGALAIIAAVGIQVTATITTAMTVTATGSDTPSLPYNSTGTTALNGDCWRPTPLMCRTNWSGVSTSIAFRGIDRFSSGNSGWKPDATNALNGWNTAPGPQYYRWIAVTNDTWIYLNYSQTGEHDLFSNAVLGITWNCDLNRFCSDTGKVPMTIWWTDVYLNHIPLDFVPINHAKIQATFAHESGHGMGLAHNPDDPSSLMYYQYNGVGVPKPHDTGTYPGCSSGGHGTSCIYGWGDHN